LERDPEVSVRAKGAALEAPTLHSTGIFSLRSIFNIVCALGALTRMEAVMHRCFVLTWALVAVIGLLLAGPQKASAQTVFACKDNTSGILFFYATSPSAGCGPGRTLETFNLTGGISAGADYQCFVGVPAGSGAGGNPFLIFEPSLGGVVFGSAISTPQTPPFNSITLQPGIYQIHLSGAGFRPLAGIILFRAELTGSASYIAAWSSIASASNPTTIFDIVGGDRLISVGQSNSLFSIDFPPPG
jgi:hypothetical protein